MNLIRTSELSDKDYCLTSLRQRVAKKWMDSMSQEQAQMIRDLIGSGNKINFNGSEFEAKEIPSLWEKAHKKNECT